MDLETIVFGNYSVQDLIVYGGIAIGVVIFLVLLKKLFTGKETSEHVQVTRCASCGWQGQVSRYAGVCPKCNQPIGEQKAKSYRENK